MEKEIPTEEKSPLHIGDTIKVKAVEGRSVLNTLTGQYYGSKATQVVVDSRLLRLLEDGDLTSGAK